MVSMPQSALLPEHLAASAKAYAHQSRAQNTKRAYRSDWGHFVRWCNEQSFPSLPASPQTLAQYLAYRADSGVKVSTLERSLAAISQAHKHAGHESPRSHALVQTVFKGIRRTLGTAAAQKPPLLSEDLRTLVRALPTTPKGIRDRALLTVGWAGAFRRAELVALDIPDLTWTREGVLLHVRWSKKDQEGKGLIKALPYTSDSLLCPVRALQDWIDASKVKEGPIFRPLHKAGKVRNRRLHPSAVAEIIRKRAAEAGIEKAKDLAAHSLRRGFITSAKSAGADDTRLMKHTGHKTWKVYAAYIADVDHWDNNPVAFAVR